MTVLSNYITDDIRNMQQWWFDDGLGLKSVIYGGFFTIFPLFLKFSLIFMNMQIS